MGRIPSGGWVSAALTLATTAAGGLKAPPAVFWALLVLAVATGIIGVRQYRAERRKAAVEKGDGNRVNIGGIWTEGQSGGQNTVSNTVNVGVQNRSFVGRDTSELRSVATEFAGTQVLVVAEGGSESAAFAQEIVGLLADCGWDVRGPDQVMLAASSLAGLELRAPGSAADVPAWIERLGKAFIGAGFDCHGAYGHSQAEIRVGRAT